MIMTEDNSIKCKRISAIAREFNVGVDSIIYQLEKSKWYKPWDEWTLNSKITEEQYNWLKEQFRYELELKEKFDNFSKLRSKKQEGTLTDEERSEYIALIPPAINNKRRSANTKKGKKGRKSKKRTLKSTSEKYPISTHNSVHMIYGPMGNKR